MRNWSIGSFENSEGGECNGIVMDMMDTMDMMKIVVGTAVLLNGYWNE